MASAFTLLAYISTSMTAPALTSIAVDLNIYDDFLRNMTLSVFLLGSAFGSLLTGSLCEVLGRRPVLLSFNIIFLIFNTLCGFASNGTQLIVYRAFAGFGGRSVSLTDHKPC